LGLSDFLGELARDFRIVLIHKISKYLNIVFKRYVHRLFQSQSLKRGILANILR
jgi:predicted nuclease of restriction endonuclease-like (RecB) superfamily